jgi:hypothetical protein
LEFARAELAKSAPAVAEQKAGYEAPKPDDDAQQLSLF